MFRRLYWVTEQVDPMGRSRVGGVYTSIPDLIHHGLVNQGQNETLRITLTKLDSDKEPFGTWSEPYFEGLETRLEEFIRTDEFSAEHCKALVDALRKRTKAAA